MPAIRRERTSSGVRFHPYRRRTHDTTVRVFIFAEVVVSAFKTLLTMNLIICQIESAIILVYYELVLLN